MFFFSAIKISYKNITSAKFRSFLTILGIIIGVASVILVMAIGSSAQALILDQVSSIGSNLVGVLPGASDEKGPPASALGIVTTTLKYDDLKAIANKKNVPEVTNVTGYVTGSATVKYQDNSFITSYQGVSADLVNVEKADILKGRFFMPEEDTNLARVAVLGYTKAQDLFPNDDPIGKTIVLKDLSFMVIGVMDKRGSQAFSNSDDLIFVPIFSAQKLLLGIDYLNFLRVKVDSPEDIDRAVEDIKITLRNQHHIKDPKNDDFSVRTTAQALLLLTNITNILKYFLTSIAAISLLVGGVGIMNIMLISVTQRIREIGLRKAVGARNSNIISQFLIESVFISLLGGTIGIISGITMAFLSSVIIKSLGYSWQFIISWQSIPIAVSVTIAIGIIFGVYPARKASKVSPMEALRYE